MTDIIEKFGNRIRVRVCALIFNEQGILLVKHKNLGKENVLWAPPGGGINFGESALQALKREVLEETGLQIKKASFKFINEFIDSPLHAVELFFHVTEYEGEIIKGSDPEMGASQIIEMVKFVTFEELCIMHDSKKHNILHSNPSRNDLIAKEGHISYFKND